MRLLHLLPATLPLLFCGPLPHAFAVVSCFTSHGSPLKHSLPSVPRCRLPHSTITDPPRPYVTPLSSLALLPELSGWISHCFYRDNILAMLDAQV